MIHAYSELYLDNAMETLGEMFAYAIDQCSYAPDEFFRWFIQCGLADEFGNGNPKYAAGMSGIELAAEVIRLTKGVRPSGETLLPEERSQAYWSGWSLAYYQWYSAKSFQELYQGGLTMEKILSMYLLHEADLSKFVKAADHCLSRQGRAGRTNLQMIRKARGLTQQQLSVTSGVSLRMIQLYEQRKNNIGHAAVATVRDLAAALGCRITDLLE